jgi:hypothetical protein
MLASTRYTLTVATDDVRGQTLEVVSGTIHAAYNISLVGNKSWRFRAWVYTGTVYLDNCKEFGDGLGYDPDEREKLTCYALDRLIQAVPDGTTGGYT